MKYCKKCNTLFDDKDISCKNCKKTLIELPNDSSLPVVLVRVGGVEKDRVLAVLKDSGVHYSLRNAKKQQSMEALSGTNTADVDILVSLDSYEKAKDILIGIGALNIEDTQIIESIVSKEETSCDENGEEEFEEMSPTKRFVVRAVSVILFILVVFGLVTGVDYIMEVIMNFFK